MVLNMPGEPAESRPTWMAWLQARRFWLHLISILMLVAVHPITENSHELSAIVEVFFLLVVISGTFALNQTPRRLAAALVLGLLAAVATGIFHATESFMPSANRPAIVAQLLTYIAFLLFASWLMLRDVMHEKRVTSDTICGAISVYMMLGISWAFWFCILEVSQPGSFAYPEWLAPPEGTDVAWHLVSTFIYFSFTTMTTLGYGDVTPISAAARTFTWLEAVTGQLYLAVLVAKLVAMRVAGQPD